MRQSQDYHDYVFKDGKLVGEFDEMYKNSKDIPWHQDKTSYGVFADIDIAILKQYKYKSICDVGCGLGYFTDRLSRELGAEKVTGIDMSETAVAKAGRLFPNCDFITGDLAKKASRENGSFDLVVIKDILWYVIAHLDDFMKNLIEMVNDNGYLYISQTFPECEKWVGQDVIDTPERLVDIASKVSNVSYYCIERDWNYNGRPVIHILGRRKRGG